MNQPNTSQMSILPPADGVCPVCAIEHEDAMPHNANSLYYQMRFQMLRGRWPTWADAVAHCSPLMRERWKSALQKADKWSEPEDGEPIADPPAESFAQIITRQDCEA